MICLREELTVSQNKTNPLQLVYGTGVLQAVLPAQEAHGSQFLNNQHVHRFGMGSLVLAKLVAIDLQATHRYVLLIHIMAARANGNTVLASYWLLLKSLC